MPEKSNVLELVKLSNRLRSSASLLTDSRRKLLDRDREKKKTDRESKIVLIESCIRDHRRTQKNILKLKIDIDCIQIKISMIEIIKSTIYIFLFLSNFYLMVKVTTNTKQIA